jgi:hypothetical protein
MITKDCKSFSKIGKTWSAKKFSAKPLSRFVAKQLWRIEPGGTINGAIDPSVRGINELFDALPD